MNRWSWRRLFDFDSDAWVVPLIVATVLAGGMAWMSAFNAHPDEIHHMRAADYYRTHWVQPLLSDPAALPSYSKYGYSYLYSNEIVYLLAGKWSLVVAPLVGSVDLSYRLFNVALLGAIALAFAFHPGVRPFLLPLALSAQVWYVFSYFNGDAFALLVALFVAYQITAPASRFNAASTSGTRFRWFTGILALGIGLGLLLLAKQNYYLLLPFLAAYVMIRQVGIRAAVCIALATLLSIAWQFRMLPYTPVWAYRIVAVLFVGICILDILPRFADRQFRRLMGALAGAAFIAMFVFLPRVAYDKLAVQNPANRSANVTVLAQTMASNGFKPSQIANNSAFWGLRCREHGMPYQTMLFASPGWLYTTYRSSVGVFGWMTIFCPPGFYLLAGVVYGFFLLALGREAWRGGNRVLGQVLALAIVFFALLVLISSLYSWTLDFQAQGRYLFPGLAILGVAISDIRQRGNLKTPLPEIMAWAAFLCALYAFTVIGLGLIPWQ